jgi:hypothetical protein
VAVVVSRISYREARPCIPSSPGAVHEIVIEVSVAEETARSATLAGGVASGGIVCSAQPRNVAAAKMIETARNRVARVTGSPLEYGRAHGSRSPRR